MDAQLISKRETLLQQMARVHARVEAVQNARRAIERETMSDAEAILHRLRSAEAVKLSVLQHDMDTLRLDVEGIDGFHTKFSKHWPRAVVPRDGLGEPGSRFDRPDQAVDFMRAYPDLVAEADRLLGKPLKTDIDVRADDFERETAVRTQSLIKFDAMADLLAAKDAMIWRLLQERTACTAEVEAVGRASSAEIEEWKRLTDRLTTELLTFRLACTRCGVRLSERTVNTACSVGQHHFVKVDAPA